MTGTGCGSRALDTAAPRKRGPKILRGPGVEPSQDGIVRGSHHQNAKQNPEAHDPGCQDQASVPPLVPHPDRHQQARQTHGVDVRVRQQRQRDSQRQPVTAAMAVERGGNEEEQHADAIVPDLDRVLVEGEPAEDEQRLQPQREGRPKQEQRHRGERDGDAGDRQHQRTVEHRVAEVDDQIP